MAYSLQVLHHTDRLILRPALRPAHVFRHYDRLQRLLDSASRVCFKCREAWIDKGPHRQTIDGQWCCGACDAMMAKGVTAHGNWCNPVLLRQVAPALPILNRAELQIVAPICTVAWMSRWARPSPCACLYL